MQSDFPHYYPQSTLINLMLEGPVFFPPHSQAIMELRGAESRRSTLGRLTSAATDMRCGRGSGCQVRVLCFEGKSRVGGEEAES